MTYGLLLDRALAQTALALVEPVQISSAQDAIMLADARVRLYRGLAGALRVHLRLSRASADGFSGAVRSRVYTLVETLHSDLRPSVRLAEESSRPPRLQGAAVESTAGRLVTASDAAGGAWDLLASHLAGSGDELTPDGRDLRSGGSRVTLADATLLLRGVAELDGRIESPLREMAARSQTNQQARRRLVAAADDARRITRLGTADFAGAVSRVLRSDDRRGVDELDVAPAWPHHVIVDSPRSAVTAAATMRMRAHRKFGDLTVLDLAAMAAVASRVTHLAAVVGRRGGATADVAAQTAAAWRRGYMAAAELRAITDGVRLNGDANRFCTWADRQLAKPAQHRCRGKQWLPAVQEMTAYLPQMALSAQLSIWHQVREGRLYHINTLRTPEEFGYHWLYRQADMDDTLVPRLRAAFADAQDNSIRLAGMMYDLSPESHPRPWLVTRTRLPVEVDNARPDQASTPRRTGSSANEHALVDDEQSHEDDGRSVPRTRSSAATTPTTLQTPDALTAEPGTGGELVISRAIAILGIQTNQAHEMAEQVRQLRHERVATSESLYRAPRTTALDAGAEAASVHHRPEVTNAGHPLGHDIE
jgi:hypothetical protein